MQSSTTSRSIEPGSPDPATHGIVARQTSKEEPAVEQPSERPARPSLESPNQPPVVIKQPPPFSVRLAQFLWVLSFLAGTVAVGFLVAIREEQLPQIADAVREVNATRAEETYTSAAEIVYWSAFGIMVTLLLVQITLLVSFMNRRKSTRWWQFGTVAVQFLLFLVIAEMVARGDQGASLRQLMTAQVGLALLAMLMSVFPGAIAWTARQHDIRRGTIVSVSGTEL
jgi:hypothetical protein